MAKPIDPAAFKGGNKSLTLAGKTFPIGPQTAAFKKPDGAGAITLSTPGMVFEGFDCRGRDIVIAADNVTVRSCLMNATSWYALNNTAGKRGFVAEFNMLDGEKQDNQNAAMCASEAGDSIVRNNIFLFAPTDMVIMCGGLCEHNVFAGSFYQTGAHADAFSIGKSLGPMVFRENYVDFSKQPDGKGPPNSCIKVVSHFGPVDDVLIDRNVLLGGGYNMYCGPSPHPVNSVRVTNNLYGLSAFGAGTEAGFIVGGGVSPANGSNFQKSSNQQFATAPDNVVILGASGAQPAPTPSPTPGPAMITNTTKPMIEGTFTPGGNVVTRSGTWAGVPADAKWSWVWKLDGKAFSDTGYAVALPSAAGGKLTVDVTVTPSTGSAVTVSSDPVTIVGPIPAPQPIPAPAPAPAPTPAPDPTAQLRAAMVQTAATLESLAGSLRQLAK